ncbi:MAG TPA: hypothetical protein VG056_09940 [Pirellulales bacterium]|nr:hypothetical protein [Pirellulales bacterium]
MTIEEFHFLSSRCAAQDGGAVWEAAEPVDDVLVGLRVFCQLRITQARKELYAARLSIDTLLMLEWQIQEHSFVAAERVREALGDGVPEPSALASLANTLGVPRNMLCENWSSAITAASAVLASASRAFSGAAATIL